MDILYNEEDTCTTTFCATALATDAGLPIDLGVCGSFLGAWPITVVTFTADSVVVMCNVTLWMKLVSYAHCNPNFRSAPPTIRRQPPLPLPSGLATGAGYLRLRTWLMAVGCKETTSRHASVYLVSESKDVH